MTTLDGDWGQVGDTLSNAFFGDNSISELPADFAKFKSLVWLNLDNNNFEDIPSTGLSPNVHTLSLNGNLLRKFPPSLGQLKNLAYLYMRGNIIRHLELPSFPSFSLELLDLGENSIQSIDYVGGRFSNHSLYIKDFNLAGNKLSRLPMDAFKNLEISRMHLSSNGLVQIDDSAFRGLEYSLEYLSLENNLISSFPKSLSEMKKLSYLYLANNDLRNLTEENFHGFAENLKALSLGSNNFQSVPTEALSNCTNLLHLNLGYNKLYRVVPGEFDWAENLEILLLRNNIINSLKPQSFRGI